MLTFWNSARKTVTAAVTGVIGWCATVIASEAAMISQSEWLGLATILAIALGVYGVANKTDA